MRRAKVFLILIAVASAFVFYSLKFYLNDNNLKSNSMSHPNGNKTPQNGKFFEYRKRNCFFWRLFFLNLNIFKTHCDDTKHCSFQNIER